MELSLLPDRWATLVIRWGPSVRYPQFVVNPQKRLLDRVLLDTQLLRDFAIPEPIRDKARHLVLSWAQQINILCVDHTVAYTHAQCLEDVAELFAEPELAAVHNRYTTAESTEWLVRTAEQSVGPRPQRVDDKISVVLVYRENEANAGITAA